MPIRRISCRDDPNRPEGAAGRGWAVVDIEGDGLPSDGFRYGVFRPDRKEFLGQSGWQPDETWLTPARVDGAEPALSLAIEGVQAVHLELGSNYRFRLDGAGVSAPIERTLAWRNVTPLSKEMRLDILAKGPAAPPPSPPVVVAPPPPPAPEPVVEPVPEPGLKSEPRPEPEPKPKSILPLILVAVLAVAGIGGGVWWLLNQPPKPVATAEPTPPAPAPAPTPPPAPAETPADRMRRLLAQGSADELMAEAEQYRQQGKPGEAELMLRGATDKGSAEAVRRMGVLYDPVGLTPGRTTQRPDGSLTEAYTYYRRAIGAGSVDARADLARLKAHAQRQADQGDTEASELLGRWQD